MVCVNSEFLKSLGVLGSDRRGGPAITRQARRSPLWRRTGRRRRRAVSTVRSPCSRPRRPGSAATSRPGRPAAAARPCSCTSRAARTPDRKWFFGFEGAVPVAQCLPLCGAWQGGLSCPAVSLATVQLLWPADSRGGGLGPAQGRGRGAARLGGSRVLRRWGFSLINIPNRAPLVNQPTTAHQSRRGYGPAWRAARPPGFRGDVPGCIRERTLHP